MKTNDNKYEKWAIKNRPKLKAAIEKYDILPIIREDHEPIKKA